LRVGHFLVGGGAAAAYRRLPGVSPPWLLALASEVPMWVQTVAYFTTLFLLCNAGLLIAALVRPKNRSADVVAGAITGLVCGATVFVLAGWLAIIPAAIDPIRPDIERLSAAAWEGRGEELLEKYPDLRKVPPRRR